MSYISPGGSFEQLDFVHVPAYRRSVEQLRGDDEQRAIEEILISRPEAGAVIARTGGVRKLRIPLVGRGKRGGARVIYLHRRDKGRIYLILAYAKGRKETLTSVERMAMRKLTAAIESEP